MELNKVYQGNCLDVLKTFEDNSIDCCISSPPYWGLRSYNSSPQIWDGDKNCEHNWVEHIEKPKGGKGSKGANVGANRNDEANRRDKPTITNFCSKCSAWRGELGQEPHFKFYIQHIADIFQEVMRVLKPEGTCFVNLGDTYNGFKQGNTSNKGYKENTIVDTFVKQKTELPNKCLCMIPERFAIEMIDRGFILRNKIIWQKNNQMPSSDSTKFTVDFEDVFFFVKSEKYYFEQQLEESITCEEDRNMRTVWNINTEPTREGHIATFPQRLVEIPIKAGCPENGIVLDPFFGSGTTGIYARKANRNFIGIELNEEYIKISEERLHKHLGMFS